MKNANDFSGPSQLPSVKKFGAIRRRDFLTAAGAGTVLSMLGGVEARAQTLVLDSAAGFSPVTSWFNGKLYALWKDPGNGGELEYAVCDGSIWSLQLQIPKANSSVSPSLATFGNKLYAAWKGKDADKRIWYSAFDGSNWSSQAQIPGSAALGGPALSVSNMKLYAVWKGADAVLSSTTFDGSKWENSPKAASLLNPSFPVGLHPFSPQMIARTALSGVDQGKYGDCVFQAALVAAASTTKGQSELSKAITQNADASFHVTFPGDPQHPVRVTENELITTQVRDDAKWARILEAAMIISYPSFANGGHPPTYAPKTKNVTGSPAVYALYLLTGSPASKDLASSSEIGKRIAQALGNGQPTIAFCANNDGGALVAGHEWTVISCDPQRNRITLRNPWGHFKTAGTSQNGILYDGDAEVSMTLQQFGKFYNEVTFGYENV